MVQGRVFTRRLVRLQTVEPSGRWLSDGGQGGFSSSLWTPASVAPAFSRATTSRFSSMSAHHATFSTGQRRDFFLIHGLVNEP
jgi:hypothetical protein